MLVQKTVYFREEDIPLWERVTKKAEWLHNALHDKNSPGKADSYPPSAPESALVEAPVKEIKAKLPSMACKHGYSPMMCKFAKNGKPCK